MYIEFFACMYACVPHMFGDHEGQKTASYSLKMNLQKIVSCHVDAGPLQEHSVIWTDESTLQPKYLFDLTCMGTFVCIYVCVTHVCSTSKGQREVLEPLELKV